MGTGPATILGPYGEGYCTECHFIEPLGPDGLIEQHQRDKNYDRFAAGPTLCPGSGGKPPARTPFSSSKARFRTTVERAVCSTCGNRAKILHGVSEGYWAGHNSHRGARCVASFGLLTKFPAA